MRGHGALVFERQELVNPEEDAVDHLTIGSGYTWLAVLCVHRQNPGLRDVNSFFGNLKNSGHYEVLWGGFNDDNTLWIGARNSTTFGRWNAENPKVLGPKLEEGRFYLLAGRMGAGVGEVKVELFVSDARPAAALPFPVNPKANASKMAIGQERNAANHPGHESFTGEFARMLIWDRPLADGELAAAMAELSATYGLARPTGGKLVWTGAGANDKWSTAAHWRPARVPGPDDAVVLDGTSAKNSRWDGERHIAALTSAPEYQGQLTFAGHGTIAGDVVLSGRPHSARDMHQWLWMRGSRVNLSGVTKWTQASRYSGGIDLGGTVRRSCKSSPRPPCALATCGCMKKAPSFSPAPSSPHSWKRGARRRSISTTRTLPPARWAARRR